MWTTDDFGLLYKEFLGSGKTVKQFCADAGVLESRFFRWQRKLREAAAAASDEFMPVSVNNRGGKVVLMDKNHPLSQRGSSRQPSCEICFPNGVTVRLNGNLPLEVISSLVMLPQ